MECCELNTHARQLMRKEMIRFFILDRSPSTGGCTGRIWRAGSASLDAPRKSRVAVARQPAGHGLASVRGRAGSRVRTSLGIAVPGLAERGATLFLQPVRQALGDMFEDMRSV